MYTYVIYPDLIRRSDKRFNKINGKRRSETNSKALILDLGSNENPKPTNLYSDDQIDGVRS
jgi:hypothetical protein